MVPQADGGSRCRNGARCCRSPVWKMRSDAAHGQTMENVLQFMVFDADNPSSHHELPAWRVKTPAVRGTITSEMWEAINHTWLEMRDYHPLRRWRDSEIGEFFEWVKDSARTCRAASRTAPCCATKPSASCAWAPSSSVPTTRTIARRQIPHAGRWRRPAGRRRRLLSVERTAALGLRLRGLSQGVSRSESRRTRWMSRLPPMPAWLKVTAFSMTGIAP
jgi:hypothetical protein